jgi:hypothetical protein
MRKWILLIAFVIVASVIVFVVFLRPHSVVPIFTFANVDGQELLKSQDVTLILSKTLDDKHTRNSNLKTKKKIGIVDDRTTLYQFQQDGKTYVFYEMISKQKPFIGTHRTMEERVYEYQ